MSWDPEKYIRGNYFQREINEAFRKTIKERFHGDILDVGCGDGSYTRFFAEQVRHRHILGIDSSAEMIDYANQRWARGDLSFATYNIEDFDQPQAFDFICSFWCLHWTNIELSLANIFKALKPGGKLYAVFSSFSDHSILQAWQELMQEGRYEFLNNDSAPDKSQFFYQVIKVITALPFKQVRLKLQTITIPAPTIDSFKNLVRTMPFMKAFASSEQAEAFIADMASAFQAICQRRYGGALYYETRPIYVEALK